MVFPHIKCQLPPYINVAPPSGQEGRPKNNLGVGVFGHLRNLKVIKHIEITYLNRNILQNTQTLFHGTIHYLECNMVDCNCPKLSLLKIE